MATVSETAAPAHDGEPFAVPGSTAPAGGTSLAVGGWSPGAEPGSKSDRYLTKRLAAAGADYKSVALTTFLLGAAVAGAVWLACGVLVEHWLMPGGLSPALRWAWLAAALLGLAAATVRWVVPLVRYRVNLVYAARAIEREHPELHNDLVNTVLVKAHPDLNPDKVVRSLERRTAKQLATVPAEAVIDRSVPLRLACVLAAFVGLACFYELVAPKSLLVSGARLLAPWVGWAAPSRVKIGAPRLAWRIPAEQGGLNDGLDRRRIVVENGTATLVRGRQLVVAADVRGLRGAEKPVVLVTPLRADGTADPGLQAWSTEMTRLQAAVGGERMFVALVPDATRGLDHAVSVTLAAGDARTAPLSVKVVDSPALLVREIRYAFPAYTRRAPETTAWQGDIRAVEGTEVTVVAECNQPLDDAWIDFDGDGSRDLKFTKSANDLARVTKSFRLHLKSDGSGPEHTSYQLHFQPRSSDETAGRPVITDPLEHRIEVIADVAPEVAIEEPRESPLRVPPAAPVTVRVVAHDPDFALAKVGIETRLQGEGATRETVILGQEHVGSYRGGAQLVPERLGAGPGATLEYRALAVDNRPKQPNVSYSPWQVLRIDPSAPARQPEPPPAARPEDRSREKDQSGQAETDGQSAGQKGNPGESGNEKQGQDQPRDAAAPREQNDSRSEGQKQQPPQGQQQKQGKQDGQAEGAQAGDRQQPQAGAQAGNQSGQGQNQGQGAEQGQGVGAQGDRQGGESRQAGKQPGMQEPGAQQRGAERGEGRQAGGAGQDDDQTKAGDGQADSRQTQGRGKERGQRRGARDSAVAADGTNDGEAMERILDHRREQEKGTGQGGRERGGESREQRPGGKDSQRQPQNEEGHEHGQCTAADGKPCGKESCPTCQGQAGGGQGSGQGTGQGTGQEDGQAGEAPGAADGAAAGTKGGAEAGQRGGEDTQMAGGNKAGGDAGGQSGEKKDPNAGDAPGKGRGADAEGTGTQPQDQGGAEQSSAQPREGGQSGQRGEPAPGQSGGGSGQTGAGGRAGGETAKRPDAMQGPEGPTPSKETEWGEQDIAHARNAADLAIEHLRESVDSGQTDVLDRLGWTPEQARAFLDRWEAMRRLAGSDDPAKRGEFERTVRSLGLRPDGVRSSREVPSDARGGQAQGRRSRPPADYWEQFKAYTQGIAGE